MALILNIDTAFETASICLCDNNKCLPLFSNNNQKDHAAWLHIAIQASLDQAGKTIRELDAIAVNIGPGSYTGLRVGLSAAKGLCYATGTPLITVNTLETIANSVRNETAELICPIIHARKNEVYTALYDKNMTVIEEPSAKKINEYFFNKLVSANDVVFCSNNSSSFFSMFNHCNVPILDLNISAINVSSISQHHFYENRFKDVAYSEPLYIKEFYSTTRAI